MTERFVGRVDETARAIAALDRALSGDGALVVFRGEAGIGKTRLAERTASLAKGRGARVVWGRAWEEGGAPPYWPWILVFRELGLSDVFTKATERFELFDRVVGSLREAAEDSPLVVVLDDLHAADVPTLLLLQFVVRSLRKMRLLVVVTHREAEASRDAVDVLAKVAREGQVVALRRLSEAEVATWVRGELDDATDEIVRAVYGVTEGNPLFVGEVLRLNAFTGADVPEDVRAIVRQHLRRLTKATSDVLSRAAVLGREVRATELRVLLDDPKAADAAIAEGLSAGVLVRSAGQVGFAHGLLREGLLLELSPAELAALHWRAGEARLRDPAQLSLAAHHLLAGALVGDVALAVETALRAARHAMEIAAFEDAAQLLQHAMDLDGRREDVGYGELLTAYGEACIASGAIDRGRDACAKAASIAKRQNERALLVRAALAYAPEFTYDGRSDPTMVTLLRDALAALPEGPSAERARVLARLACALLPPDSETIPEVRKLSDEALHMARSLDDPDTRMYVLTFASLAVGTVLGTEHQMLDELFALVAKRGRKLLELQLGPWRILDLHRRGEKARAESAIEAYAKLVDDVGHAHYRWRVPILRTLPLMLAGRFEEADALGQTAVTATPETVEIATLELAALRIAIAAASERPALLAPYAAEIIAAFAPTPFANPFTMYVLAAIGQIDEARARFESALARHGELHPCVIVIAEAVLLLRDETMARAMQAHLARTGFKGFICGPMGGYVLGPTERVLGDFAVLLNDPVGARACYAAALASCRAIGAEAQRAIIERRLASLGAPAARRKTSSTIDLVRDGDGWRLTAGSTTMHLKAQKGAAYLAYLLERPRSEVHVMELLAIEGETIDGGDAGAILDPKAKAQYAARVDDLRDQIEEATRFGDEARVTKARAELDAVAEQLAHATGLGGRDRKAAAQVERARINVQRCLKDTIKRIAQQDAELGRRLEAEIKTGTYCSFDPI